MQELPIYEPGLDEVVKAARDRNLFFSTDTHKHVAEGDIIFVRYCTDSILPKCLSLPLKAQELLYPFHGPPPKACSTTSCFPQTKGAAAD